MAADVDPAWAAIAREHRRLPLRPVAALLSISIAACGQEDAPRLGAVTVSVAPPTASVAIGDTQQFSATVTRASDTGVEWSIDEGGVAGNITAGGLYSASSTTGVFHVRATAHADPSVSGSATVTIVPATGSPTITSFVATPPSITAGQTSTLSWSVVGATALAIDNGVGSVTGTTSTVVAPTATTTYTLTATNATGSATATRQVTVAQPGPGVLRVLGSNPRYFTDGTGRAVYLVGSHTWNNFQDIGQTSPPSPLDFDAYLAFLASHHHDFFRLWKRELPTLCNWANGTWHVSPFPWLRTGPGTASDGLPKFDLTRFDQTYFDRLRARVVAAGDAGMYAAIMLFGGFDLQFNRCSNDGFPLTGPNNVNGIHDGYGSGPSGVEAHTLDDAAIVAIEEAYVRKVIDSVNDLDNVLYEISNESGPYSTPWQLHMIDLVRSYEATLPKAHPVGMTFQYPGGSNSTLFGSPADWISPGETDGYGCNGPPPAATGAKVVVNDTDHSCYYTGLQGLGVSGQRRWVWQNFVSGNNLLFMDPYLIVWTSRNDPVGGQPDPAWDPLRNAMGETLDFASRVGLAAMTPQPSLSSTGFCLANVGAEYLVYQPSSGAFSVTLAAGTYAYEWFDPENNATAGTGTTSAAGGPISFTAPFAGDAVLHLERQ